MKNLIIVDSFMLYIFNKWSFEESKLVFGDNLGRHIYNKWCDYRNNRGDQLEWYANLDETCRNKLVARAIECYTTPTSIDETNLIAKV